MTKREFKEKLKTDMENGKIVHCSERSKGKKTSFICYSNGNKKVYRYDTDTMFLQKFNE